MLWTASSFGTRRSVHWEAARTQCNLLDIIIWRGTAETILPEMGFLDIVYRVVAQISECI